MSVDVTLYHGDCLDVMAALEPQSVNAIITDLPYGTTACSWDEVIPFAPMWEAVKHVLKPRGVFVTTASQPFTSKLVMSNLEWFKYEYIWDKVNLYTGALLANKIPMRRHESVCVFYAENATYNKQFRAGQAYTRHRAKQRGVGEYATKTYKPAKTVNTGQHNPCSVLEIEAGNRSEKGLHPTQKPVALYSYLIRTYTNPGDTVLDFCMGSGTTGVAAVKEGRHFVGVEQDANYFAIAEKRIAEAQMQLPLFAQGAE